MPNGNPVSALAALVAAADASRAKTTEARHRPEWIERMNTSRTASRRSGAVLFDQCRVEQVCRGPKFLKRDELKMNRHRALALCLGMIFSENRFTLFRIML
jgi:hypothetical protein